MIWLAWAALTACDIEGEPLDDDGTAVLGSVCDRADDLLATCTGVPATETPVQDDCGDAARCAAECAITAHADGGCDALVGDNAGYLQCTAGCSGRFPVARSTGAP